MIAQNFRLAILSPTRRASFRRAVLMHFAVVAALMALVVHDCTRPTLAIVAQLVLVIGIVEGASLIGWRLTQLPKSQALEFLLVSSVPPWEIFAGELLVGVVRFLLVQLTALPLFCYAVLCGAAEWDDVIVLAAMPATWGAFTGLALTAWIYESKRIRCIGEIFAFAGIGIYLVIGVMAAENLKSWLQELDRQLPGLKLGDAIFHAVVYLNNMNPFGVVRYWFRSRTHGLDLLGTIY